MNSKAATAASWALLALILLTALRAWVLTVLWGWFVVPLGVPAIDAWHAFGLSLLMELFTYRRSKDDPLDGLTAALAEALALYAIALGLGQLAHWGMT
jgi:hypothetical protein